MNVSSSLSNKTNDHNFALHLEEKEKLSLSEKSLTSEKVKSVYQNEMHEDSPSLFPTVLKRNLEDHEVKGLNLFARWTFDEGKNSLLAHVFTEIKELEKKLQVKKSALFFCVKALNALYQPSEVNPALVNEAFSLNAYYRFKEGLHQEVKEKCSRLYFDLCERKISLENLIERTKEEIPGFSMKQLIHFKGFEKKDNLFPWKALKRQDSALASHIKEKGINSLSEGVESFYQYALARAYLEEIMVRFENECALLKENALVKTEIERLENRKLDVTKAFEWDVDEFGSLIDELIRLYLKANEPSSSSDRIRILTALFFIS